MKCSSCWQTSCTRRGLFITILVHSIKLIKKLWYAIRITFFHSPWKLTHQVNGKAAFLLDVLLISCFLNRSSSDDHCVDILLKIWLMFQRHPSIFMQKWDYLLGRMYTVISADANILPYIRQALRMRNWTRWYKWLMGVQSLCSQQTQTQISDVCLDLIKPLKHLKLMDTAH